MDKIFADTDTSPKNKTPLIYSHFDYTKRVELRERLEHIFNKLGINNVMGIRDFILAEMVDNFLCVMHNTKKAMEELGYNNVVDNERQILMKELSIEEKAKRFDQAIKVAKSKIKNDKDHVLYEDDVIEIFPELKESEDERIMKELTEFLKSASGGFLDTTIQCKTFGKWLTWLKKQGGQNTVVVIPKFRVGDVIRPKGSTAEYTIESISGECYHGKGWGLHISCDDDYELVEQNSAWSEEDEKMLRGVITMCDIWSTKTSFYPKESNDIENLKNWLKSLKDRCTLKPSEKMLEALK